MSSKRVFEHSSNAQFVMDKYKKKMDLQSKNHQKATTFADPASAKKYSFTGIVLKNETSKFVSKARSVTVAILHGQAPTETIDVLSSCSVPGVTFILPTVKHKDDAPDVNARSPRHTELLVLKNPVAQMIGAGVLRVQVYPSIDGGVDPSTSITPGLHVQVNGVKVVQNERDPYKFHVNANSKLLPLSEPDGFKPLESIWRQAATEEKSWAASSFWWSIVAGGFLQAENDSQDDESSEQQEEQKNVFRRMWTELPEECGQRLLAKAASVKSLSAEWTAQACEMLNEMAEQVKQKSAKELAKGLDSLIDSLPQLVQGDDDLPALMATLHLGRSVQSGIPSALEPIFLGCVEDESKGAKTMARVACAGMVDHIVVKGNLIKMAIKMVFVGDSYKASAEIDAGNLPLITSNNSQVGVKISSRTIAAQLGVKTHSKLQMLATEMLPYADITLITGVCYKEVGIAGNLNSFFPQEIVINAIDGIQKIAVKIEEEFVVKYLTNDTRVFAKTDDTNSGDEIDFTSLNTPPKMPMLFKDGYQAITEATCKVGDAMKLPESINIRKYGVVFDKVAKHVETNKSIAESTSSGEKFLTEKAEEMKITVEDFLTNHAVVYCYV